MINIFVQSLYVGWSTDWYCAARWLRTPGIKEMPSLILCLSLRDRLTFSALWFCLFFSLFLLELHVPVMHHSSCQLVDGHFFIRGKTQNVEGFLEHKRAEQCSSVNPRRKSLVTALTSVAINSSASLMLFTLISPWLMKAKS